jgi:hypothetical protein
MDNLVDSDDDIYDWKADPDKKNEAAYLASDGNAPNSENSRSSFSVYLDHPYNYNEQINSKQKKSENEQLVFKNVTSCGISKLSIGAPHCKWIDIHVPDFPENSKIINYDNESIVNRVDGGLELIEGSNLDQIMSLGDAERLADRIHTSTLNEMQLSNYEGAKQLPISVSGSFSSNVLHRTFNLNQMKIFIKMKYIWPGYKLLHKIKPDKYKFDWTTLENALIEVYPQNKLFIEYYIPDFTQSLTVLGGGDGDEEEELETFVLDSQNTDKLEIKIVQQHFFTCEFSISVDNDRRTGK